jgi:2-polyprenyl-3-methyl-5-hydroxy-6-metoxy-1,4-benzoquinol methylase
VVPEIDKGQTEVSTGGKTSNEKYYDETYMKWQQPLNKIAALYKKRYWRDCVTHDMACAEFGCSMGFILHSMPCREKVSIGLNDAGRNYANYELKLDVVRGTSEDPSSSQDFVLSASVLEHAECPAASFANYIAL